MVFKHVLLVAVTLSFAGAGDALAYSSSSKSTFKSSHTCHDKVAAKGLAKKDAKTEYAKCLNDPTGYQ